MKSEIKDITPTKKNIEIEVSAEEFDVFCQEALKEMAKELELPGFRKGMVPEAMAKEKIGENSVLSLAAEKAIKKNWVDFFQQTNLEIVSQPIISILKLARGNPFVFSAEVDVLADILLPDVAAIAKSINKDEEIKVEQAEIEEAILWLQQSRAKFENKQGKAEKGDWVEITLNDKDKDSFILGKGHYLEDEILGMEPGQEKEAEVNGNKTKVRLDFLKKVQMPEINDEWAKSLGEFSSLEALKKNIEEGIKQEKEIALRQKKRIEFLEKMAAKTKVELPETLVKREAQGLMKNLENRVNAELGISLEEYLAQVKKTKEQVEKEFEKIGQDRVRNFLIINQIIKNEKIEAKEEEIKEKVQEMLNNYSNPEQAQKEIDLNKVKMYIEDEIKTEKAFNLFGF